MRKSWMCSLALLGALLLAGQGQARAQGPQGGQDRQPSRPTISVLGQASLRLDPDQVQLMLGVASQAASASQAAQDNAQAMERVLAALRPLLGPGDSLATVNYGLAPRNQGEGGAAPQAEAFQAVNMVALTLRQPKDLGGVLDAAAQAGANLAGPPLWGVSDPRAARLKAQALALADAQAQAKSLAEAAGLSLGPLRRLEADGGQAAPPAGPLASLEAQRPAPAATPLEPGELELTAAVRCVYELLPRP